ncbi:family 78 glycoside hydrolase catalytic domain [Streptomyces aculeolatus]
MNEIDEPRRIVPQGARVRLENLRVENKTEPLGVAVAPRFTWDVVSPLRGVRILTRRVRLRRGDVVVWDSGVAPAGGAADVSMSCPLEVLDSDTDYLVDVFVTTRVGDARATTTFTSGFLHAEDWDGSAWIAAPKHLAGTAPLFRTEFGVDRPVIRARLYATAGGIVRVHLNGAPAADDVLGPGITDYDARVPYVVWDVTGRIVQGRNALSVELGRGFYAMTRRNVWNWERAPWRSEPCVRLVAVVETDRGTMRFHSAPTWRVTSGQTTYDDLYGGESCDLRATGNGVSEPGYDDSAWLSAQCVSGPRGTLVHRRQQPISVTGEWPAVAVTNPRPGVHVLDFGRVVAGWARVQVTGPPGATITLRYGEQLEPDGRPNCRDVLGHYDGRFQTDRLTLAGTGTEVWEPRFTWKGFRYVEVEGWPGDEQPGPDGVVAKVVHTDVERTGRFRSSSLILDAIHEAAIATILNNLHSIPTDTPMFEKNGWTVDGMLGTEMFLRNLDTHELLAKWLDDIADTREDGVPKVIAPHGGWTWEWSPAPPWHAAYVLIPWWLYLHAGDRRVLEEHYDGIAAYVRIEYNRSPGGIARTTLGDWVSPETDPGGGNPPEDLRVAATAYLFCMLRTTAEIATALGRHTDADGLRAMGDRVRDAFLTTFFDIDRCVVRGDGDRGYRQAHNVLALAFRLIPHEAEARVAQGIADDVRRRGNHLNTGALATKYLLPVLTRHGHAGLALEIAQQRTFPSWGYWLERGATTLWEHWSEESRSRNHYFLGTIDDWFYTDVVGIHPVRPGYAVFDVHPRLMRHLERAEASLRCPFGRITVRWRVSAETNSMDVIVPVGTRASVVLPSAVPDTATEGGLTLTEAEGVRVRDRDDEGVRVDVESGRYCFRWRVRTET